MHSDDEMPPMPLPSQAQLLANAAKIGRIGKAVEHVSMRGYSNGAHPSWEALGLAWCALSLAEALCLAGRPRPGQLEQVRVGLEYVERSLANLD